MFQRLAADLGLGLRRLHRAPGTTLPSLLAISLASCALLLASALVQGVLLKPLPYPESERIHYVGWRNAEGPGQVNALTAAQARFVLEDGAGLATLGSYADPGTQYTLDGVPGELAERVPGLRADAGLLPALGVIPRLGRGFTSDEARDGAAVVLVSQSLWERRFADAELSGAQLRIDGVPHEVIGVLPEGFRFYPQVALMVPSEPGGIGSGGSNTHVLARLPAGGSIDSTQSALTALGQRWAASQANAPLGAHARLLSLQEHVLGDSERLFVPLVGAVGALLLLACFNVSTLLVGYAMARRGDAAVEMALGATTARLARRLLIDAGLLWAVGLMLGTGLAAVLLPQLAGWLPFQLPRLDEVQLDAHSVLMACAIGALMSLLCALLGGFGARLGSVAAGLRTQVAGRGGGVGLQPVLVAAQISLSCVLLLGCVWVVGSALRAGATHPGFRSDGIQTLQLALADARYRDESEATRRSDQLLQALQDALAAQPSIRGSATSSSLPLERGLNNWVEFPPGSPESGASLEVRAVSREYFSVLKVPLLHGDAFDGSEGEGEARRLVINATLAERYFITPAAALGSTLRMDGKDWRVVGIVADMREAGLRVPVLPTVFVPRSQIAPATQAAVNRWFLTAVLVDGPAGEVEGALREALRTIDPGVALVKTRPLEAVIGASLAIERFFGGLLLALATVSLLLTAIGLYGVLAQLLWQRRHELALRLALGSDQRRNARLLLRDGGRWIALGLLAGVPLAVANRPLLALLLDDAGFSGDLPLLGVAVVALLMACVAAFSLPLLRASRIQAVQALRPFSP